MNRRSVVIKIRLTPDEALGWKSEAAIEGETVADWIRIRVGKSSLKRPLRRQNGQLIRHIARLTNTLNQLIALLRGDGGSPAIQDLQDMRALLLELAEDVDSVG